MPIGVGSNVAVKSTQGRETVDLMGLTRSELGLIVVGLGSLVEYESISATAMIETLDLREALAKAFDLILGLPPRLTS